MLLALIAAVIGLLTAILLVVSLVRVPLVYKAAVNTYLKQRCSLAVAALLAFLTTVFWSLVIDVPLAWLSLTLLKYAVPRFVP